MKFGIVVDSSCDMMSLVNDETNEIDYSRIPLKIDVGERIFVDDNELDVDEMLEAMDMHKGKTGSAAPSPQEWLEAYEKSDNIFAITITSALSGSYNSACIARDMLLEKYSDKNIFLIDSLSTGPEMALIANRLTDDIKQGMEFDEIVEDIKKYIENTKLFFVLECIDNLVKNGRVSKIAGGIVGLLGIKMFGRASEQGTLEMISKMRGKKGAYDKLIDEVFASGYNGKNVVICHCCNNEMANYLKDKIKAKFEEADVKIMPTRGLCSYYAEKGGILLSYEL